MTSLSPPSGTVRPTHGTREGHRPRPVQLVGAGVLLAAAALLCARPGWTRACETRLAAHVVHRALGTRTTLLPEGDVFFFDAGTGRDQGLRLTLACSVVLLLVPLLLTGAAVLATGRGGPARVTAAAGVAALLLVVLNQVRLVMIVAATRRWGDTGFGWAHGVLGSCIVLAGLAVTFRLFFRMVVRARHGRG
ncbi:archaeosortase/exosortase family protein [Streptomyces sp. SPB4]|uniref:archaeosortase/exosortase family protein n=1 Tax=Streptomyces TaxID=1883 RepID=UPI0024731AE8|nr:archaeosortase/exosortase family protein [Streptomyces sp. SPB4]MDH6544039.1 exosortase/archaeosortase family protein [Streptomyces sp. SPB4]